MSSFSRLGALDQRFMQRFCRPAEDTFEIHALRDIHEGEELPLGLPKKLFFSSLEQFKCPLLDCGGAVFLGFKCIRFKDPPLQEHRVAAVLRRAEGAPKPDAATAPWPSKGLESMCRKTLDKERAEFTAAGWALDGPFHMQIGHVRLVLEAPKA